MRRRARPEWISDACESSLPCRSLSCGGNCRLRSSLDLGDAAVPVENLLAVPVQNACVFVHIVVDLFEIFDPVRLPGDVGMDRKRADFCALRAFGAEPTQLVDPAHAQIVAFVKLKQ